MRLEIGFEDFVAQFRMLFDQPGSRWHEPLLATRGDRLSLHRTTFQAEVEGGGPLAIDDHLSLIEADADGRCIGVVAFELDDVDAAYAELDARWEAGEGALYEGPRPSACARDREPRLGGGRCDVRADLRRARSPADRRAWNEAGC